MYYSITEARGTGSPMNLAVPPYIDKAHISVYIDGLQTEAFTWINEAVVSLIAPINRLVRVVRRTSPGVRLTTYMNGKSLPGDDLEVDSKQAFYMAQEAYDMAVLGGSVRGTQPGGVELTTQGILDLLAGQITPSQLELDLREKIDIVTAPASVIGSPAWLVAQETAARDGAIKAEFDARVSALQDEASERAAAIADERTLRIDADSVLASQVNIVASQVSGANAAVQSEQAARTSADEALASDIEDVVAYVDGLESGSGPLNDRLAAVETSATASASRLDGVEAQYTIKVQARSDGKFALAGIGLNATANNNYAQSEMVFLADKFTFVPSAADVNSIPQPLLVAGLVNGVNTLVVPPSRYGDQLIEARMIVDGGIQARHMTITGGAGMALNSDPGCSDVTAWVSGTVVNVSDGVSGTKALMSTGGTHVFSKPFPIRQGRTYRVSCYLRKVVAGGLDFIRFYQLDAGGVLISPSAYLLADQTTGNYLESIPVPTGWTKYVGQVAASPGAVQAQVNFIGGFGGAGSVQCQDFRCEEMLDFSLVVAGGITADRIDSRGLTIKDAAGNVIFGSGTPLSTSRIIGLGAFASLNGISSANVSTIIADGAIGNAQIGNIIQSANYNPNVSGWRINKDGTAEFNNITARGTITAKTIIADNLLAGQYTDPNQPGIQLLASGSGVYTTDNTGWIDTFVPQTCTGTDPEGHPITFDCSYTRRDAVVMTGTGVMFTTSDPGWPIERRLRTGRVRFQVILAASVDTFLSLWYRRNSGPWVFINTTNDMGPGYGCNVNQTVFSLNMNVNEIVEFGMSSTNSAMAFGSAPSPQLFSASLSVITTNF